MGVGKIKSSEMAWLQWSGSQQTYSQLEPRKTRSGVNYHVDMSDEDTENNNDTSDEITNSIAEDTRLSDENTDTRDENIDVKDEDISMSDGSTMTSDEDIDTSDEDTNTSYEDTIASYEDTTASYEDTNTGNEITEASSVSDDAATDMDIKLEGTNEEVFQPTNEYASSSVIDATRASQLEEWPEQSPHRSDVPDMKRYENQYEDFQKAPRRHTQEFREEKYGIASVQEILVVWIFIEAPERHLWLPSAFDHPRGRPYNIICQRVWNAWRRYRHDSFTDVVASIEKGGEYDWPNVTPGLLGFPEARDRHKKRRRDAANS